MDEYHIREEKVEQDIALLERVCQTAWQRDIATVEGLVERMRVELIIKTFPRRKRAVYHALIEYMEDVLEQRYENTEHDRETVRRTVLNYISRLMQGLKP